MSNHTRFRLRPFPVDSQQITQRNTDNPVSIKVITVGTFTSPKPRKHLIQLPVYRQITGRNQQ